MQFIRFKFCLAVEFTNYFLLHYTTCCHVTQFVFFEFSASLLSGSYLVLEIPHPVLVSELLVCGATLGQDPALEATHVEEEVGVVLTVNGDEALLPQDGGHRAGEAVLDVPEHGTPPETRNTDLKH